MSVRSCAREEVRSGGLLILGLGGGLFDRGFRPLCEVGKRHRGACRALGTKPHAHLNESSGQRSLCRHAFAVVEDVVYLGLDVMQGLLHGITVFAHGVLFRVRFATRPGGEIATPAV
jgi:hypothetical protein